MKITKLIHEETIVLDLEADSKSEVIEELANKLDAAGKITDKDQFIADIWDREKQGSTGIGDGVAIPHAKTSAVKTPSIVFGRSKQGIDFAALDGEPSHLFFMIAASEDANTSHLDTLAELSSMLMNESFRQELLQARSKQEVLSLIGRGKKVVKPQKVADEDSKFILAVTACPTGIAHTYMAKDALMAKAAELGINMRVETRGASGAKDKLTDEEIARADGIIIAADTNIEKGRFRGKRLIETSVGEGIRKPEELIHSIINQTASIYQAGENAETGEVEAARNQPGFYRHLMNGVSHMLPFVVGGGILIALGFLFGIEAHVEGSPEYNRFAEALNVIGGGNAFGLMIPVLAGFIAMSIADRPGLAPGMVGGFLAAQGDSGFIGGIIAGFLAGYTVILLRKSFKNLPQSLEGIKTILLYPLFSIFITGMIMFFVIEAPVGMFNTSLSNWLSGLGTSNAVILGLILGGMMAVDMGGPINKAAYTFGIAMIADGIITPHAAIMAGGMVPPLGIALATTFFKNKFTQEEQDAGKSNYIMGASFITEGAIPFAAADPVRVIPSIIVGSSVAGGLSMLFNIGLPAPHGGLFVIPIIEGNPLLYLLAILIGSAVTCILLGIFKKKVE